jgi:trk system potassium uptake protein TrkA
MYILIAGGGKVGSNLTGTLLKMGHEVTLLEGDRSRYSILEERFEHVVRYGDATELYVLERAGVERADLVVAVTGDDEDNIIVCQVASEKYGVPKVIARVNDPRNQPYFDLLGIAPTVSATAAIMGLIEHEVPEHGLIHLLELRKENLEIVEITVGAKDVCAGKKIGQVTLPEGSRLISVVRDGKAEVPVESLRLESGDSLLAILEPGKEDELRRVLVRDGH